MNIIIDVTRLVRSLIKKQMPVGIDRVTMAYVQHYGHSARALVRWSGRRWLLSNAQSKALFKWLAVPGSVFAVRFIIVKGVLANCIVKKQADTFLINTGNISLGHCHSDYLRLIHKLHVKPIFVVHDLIPISYPEYCCVGEDIRHREKMNYILSLASGIITNSTATFDDLLHYSKQTNQPMPRAKVALLASSMVLKSPRERPINKPYFVILSTIEPRKNHLLLLQIWRSLFQRLGEQTPHLFVIGQRGWECENVLDLLERCQFIKEVVTEVSHCKDDDLVTYIHHSQALLFPSFTEGFGLPLIEALSMGVPVIASDLPVFREIAGGIPEYIDPLDGKRWEEQIIEYARANSEGRMAQMIRMQNFKGPTWVEHFTKVDAFLAELSQDR